MKLTIANREHTQEGIALEFKVSFTCSACKKSVEPEKLIVGRAHVYALHCGLMQEIGCVA